MKRLTVFLFLLFLSLAGSAALGETAVTLVPETPRAGDYVDVTVVPGRENPESITYALLYGEEKEKVFSGKPVQHYVTAFRPRKEGTYTLLVTVSYGKKDSETVEVAVPVSGIAPEPRGADVVYNQKDGWWKKKKYGTTELQTSGCAIFTLSHLLQRIGFSGDAVQPDQLARTYGAYYVPNRGTYNEGLVSKAAKDYDFITQKDLLQSPKEIAASLRRGDRFSFSIVDGHIALADGISEDGTKVHIVDSAPGATYERIRSKGCIFIRLEDGTFREAAAPEDHPGVRWFFETQEYSGCEYWMDLEYCASRGMRLIRLPWLKADPGDGVRGVSVEYAGALITKVVRDGSSWRLPTRELQLTGAAPGTVQVALVTAKKGTVLRNADGKQVPRTKRIPRSSMVLLLESSEDSLYAWWDNAFGYLDPKDVTLLPAASGEFRTGIITMNGNTSGGQQVTVHLNPDRKSTGLAMWKTGTPFAAVEKQGDYWLVEAKGMRGWVHEKYLLWDPAENTVPAEGSTP